MAEFTNVTGIQSTVYLNQNVTGIQSIVYLNQNVTGIQSTVYLNQNVTGIQSTVYLKEQSLEPYFYCVTNKALRDVFIRFRMGISDTKTNKLRYSTDPSDDLSCPLCKCCVDDEINFLFVCKATEALRSKLLPQVYCQDWRKQLTILNDTEHMTNVVRYIYHSLKLTTQRQ